MAKNVTAAKRKPAIPDDAPGIDADVEHERVFAARSSVKRQGLRGSSPLSPSVFACQDSSAPHRQHSMFGFTRATLIVAEHRPQVTFAHPLGT